MTSPSTTLTAEHERIDALVELMKQEQQFLVAADADGLAGLTPRKAALVQELAQLSRERHAALGAAGFAASEAGMEPWLAAQDEPVRSLWAQLLAHTAEAKELNRVNGMLINRQMAHNQTVLSALRTPATAAPEATLYGAKGQTFGSGPSRRFVVG